MQVDALLETGQSSLEEACERLEELLTDLREQVESTGDTVETMRLE